MRQAKSRHTRRRGVWWVPLKRSLSHFNTLLSKNQDKRSSGRMFRIKSGLPEPSKRSPADWRAGGEGGRSSGTGDGALIPPHMHLSHASWQNKHYLWCLAPRQHSKTNSQKKKRKNKSIHLHQPLSRHQAMAIKFHFLLNISPLMITLYLLQSRVACWLPVFIGMVFSSTCFHHRRVLQNSPFTARHIFLNHFPGRRTLIYKMTV